MNPRWCCSIILGFALSVGAAEAGVFSRDYSIEELKIKIAALPDAGRESTKAMFLTDLGIKLYREGQFEAASNALSEASNLSPRSGVRKTLFRYLGKCYESSGRLDKAIAAFESAVKYDARNWKRYRDLARLYRQAKLYRKAIEAYNSAIKLRPNKGELYYSLGVTWAHLEFYSYAEDNFIKSLDLGQSHMEVFKELAVIFEKMGRFDEAAQSLRETITDASPDSDWARLIYLAAMAGNHDLADQSLQKFMARDVSKESVDFYADLLKLMAQDPRQILQKQASSPTLRALLAPFGR